jgi:hypothetical protein
MASGGAGFRTGLITCDGVGVCGWFRDLPSPAGSIGRIFEIESSNVEGDTRAPLYRRMRRGIVSGNVFALTRGAPQVFRAQSYTLAIADGFILIGWMTVAYLMLMLLLKPGKLGYKDLRNMQ